MSVHEEIKAGVPLAMKAKDEVRLRTLRSLLSSMTNEVVAKKRKPTEFLTDEEAVAVLKRAANQRKESISAFENASREDLAEVERAELTIIEALLPAQMPREEIEVLAKAKISEMSADKSKAGIVVGALMKDLKGKADGGLVKEVVDSILM